MKLTLTFLLVVLLCGILSANVVLTHTQPFEPKSDQPLFLNATVTQGLTEITNAWVYFRTNETQPFNQVQVTIPTADNPVLSYTIPVLPETDKKIQYYFVVESQNSILYSLPESQPDIYPFSVEISQANVDKNLILLSPIEDVQIEEDLVFVVSLYNVSEYVDSTKVRAFCNGQEVTNQCEITSQLLVYKPQKVKEGPVDFHITALLTTGELISSNKWNIQVHRNKFAINTDRLVSGNMEFVSSLDRYDNADTLNSLSDRSDASLRINTRVGGSKYYLKTNVYLADEEKSTSQSINRYSIDINLNRFELIAGDHSPNYSYFTISNRNVRGLYAQIKTRGLFFSASYGDIYRALDGKASTNPLMPYSPGTFKRTSLATRLALGTNEGFQLGFNLLKVKDQMSSLDSKYYKYDSIDSVTGDTLHNVTTKPIDNLVLGTDMKLSLFDRHFILGGEVAASLYNSNIVDGAISKDSLESYIDGDVPFDPESVEDLITINKFMQPFIPGSANVAWQAYIRTFFLGNFLQASYTSVGASFRSAAINYLQNDASTLTINDQIRITQYANISGSISLIKDNLSNQKTTTTTNTNWSAQITITPTRYSYFTTGIASNQSSDHLEKSDSLNIANYNKLDNQSQHLSYGLGYQFANMPVAATRVDLSLRTGNMKDEATDSYDISNNLISFSMTNDFNDYPMQTRITYSSYQNKDKQLISPNSTDTGNSTLALRMEYRLLNNKLKPYTEYSMNNYTGDQDKQLANQYTIGTTYLPFENTNISTNVGYKTYKNDTSSNADYNNLSWFFTLNQRF